jgi:hypothetical protein
VDSADDLVFFFDDIANQISGTQYVYIRIACPVDVTVTSEGETLSSKAESENRRTSFGTLTYENEEYDEYEDETSQVKVLRLKMDTDYDIDISGYDTGTMDYTVSYPDENGEYNDVREFSDISVNAETKVTSNTDKLDASYLKVDSNGDGKYETTYKAKANSEMEEVKNSTVLYICLGTAGIISIIVIILIIVLVYKNSKKKKQVSGAIVGVFGEFRGKVYPMQIVGAVCCIGKSSKCDIILKHSFVSRQHCIITRLPKGAYQVIDYSSKGTFIGCERMEKGVVYRIPAGAILMIGNDENVLQLK